MKLLFPLLLALSLSAAPSDHDNAVIVPSLKGLVFVASVKDIQKAGVSTPGVSSAGLPMLNQDSFQDLVSAYLNHPLTFAGLAEITGKVAAFYKQQHHPLVDVVAPEQDVSAGVIQVVVTEFRVGEVRVQGNRWFSDNLVSAPIGLQHGDTIDTQQLLGEMDAANANPFRHVNLIYQPSSQPGYTDLVLDTQDRVPVSVYAGFDNSGTPVTGRSRFNLGATWGNALWHDQQISYQFSGSDNFYNGNHLGHASYLSNTLSWSMPVRTYDSLAIFGSFQQSVPNIGADFGFLGKSGQASIRYSLGLHRTSRFVQSLQVGYDFKTTNNNLAFGGDQVSSTSTEIDQFPFAYAANLTDHLGASSFTATIVLSPGALTPENHASFFQPAYGQSGIPGAMARYAYWRGDFNRLTKLPMKSVYAFRLLGQVSSTNLLYTEKLAAGGPDILRGYDPNSILGDRGIVMSNELRSPALNPFPEHSLGEVQFLTFWDYAHLAAEHPDAGEVNLTNASSVGAGFRYNLRSNLTARVGYGWQLVRLPTANPAARDQFADVSFTMAY
jgi:hemolysin activation/secretion protein